MRVEQLAPGMVLARTIWGPSGEVLLARGARLTSATISALARREVRAVWVRDGMADEEDPADLISEPLRAAAARHVQDVYAAVARDASPGVIRAAARRLERVAESLVEEVMSSPVVGELVALKTHDAYTLQHSVEVAVGSVLLGLHIGASRSTLRELALGGLLHDVGKVRVPVEVLNKPGPLTAEEWDLVRQHPTWSYEMVSRMGLEDVLPKHIAWQHHERQDGRGYPRGLRGNNRIQRDHSEMISGDRISLCAEMAQVPDVYSALRSDRPYRPAMPPEEAVRTMREMAGSHLNREVVQVFFSTVPTFPPGITVRVYTGPLAGYVATVVRTHRSAPDRPTIRLLLDPRGRPCDPVEVDLRTHPGEVRSLVSPPVPDSVG